MCNLALRGLRQEDCHEIMDLATLGYRVRPCLKTNKISRIIFVKVAYF